MHDVGSLDLLRRRPRPFALLEKGFRPFFLLAGVMAAAIVPFWLLHLSGVVDLGTYLAPTYWHAHEMVFGFAAAVISGFLLTAASNWTGRETARGLGLALLATLWIAGRVTMLAAASLPPVVVAVVNLAFLPALVLAVGRVILAARSTRNAPFLVVLSLLFAAQLVMHLDALSVLPGWQRTGSIVAVDLILVLILILGGRVIPMFTRNGAGVETRSFPWLDRAAIAAMVLVMVLDAVSVPAAVVAVAAGAAAILVTARAARWGSLHTLHVPLLWVLHLGYFFIPLGLALRVAGGITPAIPPAMAIHAHTVGAIGLLTLGMMARVALGHTGRALEPGRVMAIAFGLLGVAAAVRVIGPVLGTAAYLPSLHTAGTFWTLAFLLFVIRYAPVLIAGRADGKRG